jgi:glycosyltransferase involved in cell wall biosynthesis
MKVYEYLSAGLPVVAAPLPSLEGVEGVTIAAGAEEFAERLSELVDGDDPDRRAARSALAARHSWDTRLEEIAAAFERLPETAA